MTDKNNPAIQGKKGKKTDYEVGYGKPPKSTQFKPGKGKDRDPRINPHGRPKDFDALRKLALEVLNKDMKDKEGKPIVLDGEAMTKVHMILETWSLDKNKQKDLVEIAYGKVEQAIDIKSAGKQIKTVDEKQLNRTILTFADALREVVPGEDRKRDRKVDSAK